MHIDDRHTRSDQVQAELVEAGIIMQANGQRAASAAFLKAAGVPFRVIVRVLSESGPRRPPRQR